MNLFSNYPDETIWKSRRHFIDPQSGKKVAFSDGGCRHGYGLKLMLLTGQTACAYCGISLVDDYSHWLLMAVDHVVPTKQANELGICEEWSKDYRNTVLSCSACNGLRNRWRFPQGTKAPTTWDAFVKLRNDTFKQRRDEICGYQKQEREFYGGKPWRRSDP
jgi:hypothetical protein